MKLSSKLSSITIAAVVVVTTAVNAQPSPKPASAGTPLRVAANASGTGTQNFIAKWIDGVGTLGNSLLFDNASNVGIGTTTPQTLLQVGANQGDVPNLPATTLFVTGVGP